MRRREFLGLAGAAAVFPRVALGQQRLPRIAVLSIPQPESYFDAFRQGLMEFGYVEGRNITVERFTAPSNTELPVYAARAVSSGPDIIVPLGTPASTAAKGTTSTIPIVFAIVADPVGVGFAASLARPAGNMTGTSNQAPGLVGKQLSILREALPRLKRLAILNVPADASSVLQNLQMRDAATAAGIATDQADFTDSQDLPTQFQRVLLLGADAAYGPTNTYFNSNRSTLFDMFVKGKLPAMIGAVVEGDPTPFIGLISYGPSNLDVIRRAASFVSAILMGAKPGDLPVQQPTTFELAVNLDTANKIGVTIPPSLLAQATLVIDYDIRSPKAVVK